MIGSAPPAPIRFALPPELEAREPPEARGLTRDGVRLMVAYRSDVRVVHTTFRGLPDHLRRGDVLVVNTSGTLPASVEAVRFIDRLALELHLSTPLPTGGGDFDLDGDGADDPRTWIVEFRSAVDGNSRSFRSLELGDGFDLPEGARAEVLAPYPPDCGPDSTSPGESRLWMTTLEVPGPLGAYLRRNGRPILDEQGRINASLSGISDAEMLGVVDDLAEHEFVEARATAHLSPGATAPATQLTIFTPLSQPVLDRLREVDLNRLTPLEALNLLAELKKEI